MTLTWEDRPISLRFMLGEKPLFAVRFNVTRLSGHFSELPADPDDQVRQRQISKKSDGIFIRSQPVSETLLRIKKLPFAIRYVPAQYKHYYTDLTGNFEDYQKSLSKKQKAEILRMIRKLKEMSGGELDLRQYKTVEDMADFYKYAGEISAKTYQEKLLNVGFPKGEAVIKNLNEEAARNEVYGFVLFLNNTPIAYSYGRLRDKILFSAYLGYDPEYSKYKPGSVLTYNVMEKLFADPAVRMYDHGQGEGFHKKFFATGCAQCCDLYYFRPTLRNIFMVLLHTCFERVSNGMTRLADKIGIKVKLKKYFRRKSSMKRD